MPARILLGQIVGAHGIRGDVLIRSYAAAPEDVASYGALADESGKRQFEIKVIRVTPKGVIARVAGVADRTAAERLKGTRLFAERSQLPEAEANEYYYADLVGLAAVSPAGEVLGEIVAVQNYGAGDLLEIRLTGSHKTELLPFTAESVPEVDIASGRVVIVMPEQTGDEHPKD